MYFYNLTKIFLEIEKTSSRLEKIKILSDLFIFLNKKDKDIVDLVVYLAQGRVAPFFVNIEFNVGNSNIIKAISKVYDIEDSEVKKKFNEVGDLGNAYYDLVKNKSVLNKSLTVREVFEYLQEIANTNGKNSTFRKQDFLVKLFNNVDEESGRFIIRIILGKLRLGFSDRTIIDSLAKAFDSNKRDLFQTKKIIDTGYYRCSDLGNIAKVLSYEGVEKVGKINLVPLIPVFPKLVERASNVEDIFKRIDKPLFQPKYDGLRAQIHMKKSEVGIYSRKLENLTEMFPDIVEEVKKLGFKSIILDTEVIGYDEVNDKFFPFQSTIQRKRKHNVSSFSNQIPVKSFIFDILFLDGKDLTLLTLEKRLEVLRKIDLSKSKIFCLSDSTIMNDQEIARVYFKKAIDEGLEGIIAKDVNTSYSAGTRNFEWIKFKKASVDELSDTLDCVVLGYYYGYGQRSKFGIGALLVGIYNKKDDRYETIAKLGTGVKDEQWIELKKSLDENKIFEPMTNVIIDKIIAPDVYVIPKVVVVVRADEVTKSTNHTAGRDSLSNQGYSLRFPRLVSVRDDKRPEDTTTVEELKNII